jgi:pyruvate formate lyase activating enzyme
MKTTNAKWWKKENEKVICTLCPRFCTLAEGQHGFCLVRKNENGKLVTTSYGYPTGFAIDPIEKKPLFHFLPNSKILSFGTNGCNLGCKFCQNWHISKVKQEIGNKYFSPEQIVNYAIINSIPSIAFTYNEPIIFGEFVEEVSKIAKENGIKSVIVTAGYVENEARKSIFKNIDAANVDLKGFTERFYVKYTLSHINPVLETLIWLKNETDIWMEITNLIIPNANDSEIEISQMCDWILENLGENVPLHFSSFHPDYLMKDSAQTEIPILLNAKNIAEKVGIKFVYLGNINQMEYKTTFCPNCGEKLIQREWTVSNKINLSDGKCWKCNNKIPGVWK